MRTPLALLAAVPNPTAYAVVPTLWALVARPAIQGRPVFAGGAPDGIPVVMNIVICGSWLGWYTQRHAPTAASPAV